MSERIVFGSSAAASSISFEELGKAPDGLGAWGVVDDQQWLASRAADAFELLYLSRGDFQYAVRGLAPEGVVGVVEQRRRTFARETPALALGLVESEVRACAGGLGAGPRAAAVRADLFAALASFTLVPRFANTEPVDLLDYLQEGEARSWRSSNRSPSARPKISIPAGRNNKRVASSLPSWASSAPAGAGRRWPRGCLTSISNVPIG